MGLFLKILKALLLFIASFILILSLSIFAITFSAKDVVLSADTYDGILEKSNVYDLFKEQASTLLYGQIGSTGLVSKTELAGWISQSFEKQWFDFESKKLLSNFFSYVKGEKNSLDLGISILEPKQKFLFLLQGKINSLPNASQAPVDASKLLGGQIPDKLDLLSVFGKSVSDYIEQGKNIISIVSISLAGLAIFVLVLIAIIFVFLKKQAFAFTAAVFFVASTILFSLNFSLPEILKQAFARYPETIVLSQAKTVIGLILQKLSGEMNLFAALYLAISIILIIVFFSLKNKDKFIEKKEVGVAYE